MIVAAIKIQRADSLKKFNFQEEAPAENTTKPTTTSEENNSDTTPKKKKKKKEKSENKKEETAKKDKKKKKEKAEKEDTAEKKEKKKKKEKTEEITVVAKEPLVTNQPKVVHYDSLTKPSQKPITTNQSLFTQNLLQPKKLNDKLHIQNREYWVPGVLLLSLMVMVWSRVSHSNKLDRVFKSFFNIREFYQVVREEFAMTNSLSIALMILFALLQSIFLYQLNLFYQIIPLSSAPVLFYFKIVIGVSLFFVLKLLLVRLVGFVFYGRSEVTVDVLYNLFIMNKMSAFVLIPITLSMAYLTLFGTQTVIYAGALILLLIYIYRLFRLFVITMNGAKFSKIYFFMYICSLEILPFVVIFKLIANRI